MNRVAVGRHCVLLCLLKFGGAEVADSFASVVEADGKRRLAGRWDGVHLIHHDCLADSPEAAGANLELDSFVDDEIEGLVGDYEVDIVELEELGVLLKERVLGLGEDAPEGIAVEGLETGQDREAADNLGDEAERLEVLRGDVLHEIAEIDGIARLIGIVANDTRIEALCDAVADAVESAAADKENVAGVDGNHTLLGVLASALWWDIDDGAFEKFEEALLYALSADIACDGGIVSLTGDLIDFVDEDDTSFGAFDIEIGLLEEA